MELRTERQNGVLCLCVSGRLNILEAPTFEEAITGEIGSGDRAVIMDLEELTYISSAGLYVILSTAKWLRRRNTEFALCALSEMVLEIIERTGIDRVINVYPTRCEALANLDC